MWIPIFQKKFPKSAQDVAFNMADVHVVGTPIHSNIIMQVKFTAKEKFIMDFGKDENEETLIANPLFPFTIFTRGGGGRTYNCVKTSITKTNL